MAALAVTWWWTRGDAGAPGTAPPAPAVRIAPAPPPSAAPTAPAAPAPSTPPAPPQEPVPIAPVAAIPPPVDLPGEVVDVSQLTPEQSARRRQRGVIAARLDQVLRNDTSPDGRARLAEIVLKIRDVNLRRTAENDQADELARLRREFEDIAAERYSEVMGRLADPTQWRPPRDAATPAGSAAGSPAR